MVVWGVQPKGCRGCRRPLWRHTTAVGPCKPFSALSAPMSPPGPLHGADANPSTHVIDMHQTAITALRCNHDESGGCGARAPASKESRVPPITVLVADDEPMLRQALADML